MRDFKSDIKNKLYTNNDGISSMIPYHSHGINYALDLKAEPLLRAYFVSAIIAYINRKEGLKFDDIINTVDLEDFSDEKSCSYYENLREMVLEEAYTISQIIKNYSLWGLNDKNKSKGYIFPLNVVVDDMNNHTFRSNSYSPIHNSLAVS